MKKFEAEYRCSNCDECRSAFFCARCLKARYCGVACQKAHWINAHKLLCFSAAESSVKAQLPPVEVKDACYICKDELTASSLATLPCGHEKFHMECIFQLVTPQCPLCRAWFERAIDIMDGFTSEKHRRMLTADQTGAEFIEYRDALVSAHSQGSFRASHLLIKLFHLVSPRFALEISKTVLIRNPVSTAIRYLLKLSLYLDEVDDFNTYVGVYLTSLAAPHEFNALKDKFLRPKPRIEYVPDLQTLYHVLIYILNRFYPTVTEPTVTEPTVTEPPISFRYLKMLESVGLARSRLGRERLEMGQEQGAKQLLCEALAYYNKLLEIFPRGCFSIQSASTRETIDYTSIQVEVIKNAISVKEMAMADALTAQLLIRCPDNEFALVFRQSRVLGFA